MAILHDKVIQLFTDIGVGIQTHSAEVSALKTEIGQKVNDPIVEQFSTDCTELRKEVSTVRVEIAALSLTLISSESCSYFIQ
jgi:hypothetical protein